MKLWGNDPSAVIERLRGKKAPGEKLGLVIEGGGMRGLLSAASMMCFEEAGLRSRFDAIFATSAGALNAAYLLSDQGSIGVGLYFNELANPRFIRLSNWPDLLNLRYLYEDCILRGPRRLDLERICRQPIDLTVALTEVESGKAHYLKSSELTPDLLLKALRASTATPVTTTHWEKIGPRHYNDGDMHAAVPLEPALQEGFTHLVVLLTQPHGHRRRPGRLMLRFERHRLKRYSESYQSEFFRGPERYNRTLDLLYSEKCPAKTWVIAPRAEHLIKSFSRNPKRLRRAYDLAYQSFAQEFFKLFPREKTLGVAEIAAAPST